MNKSITHFLQELQLFLEKEDFLRSYQLETMHVSKHIGFNAPLLATE